MHRRSFFRSALAVLGGVLGISTSATATSSQARNLDCAYCNSLNTRCLPTRTYKNATEYRCCKCGRTHTRKAGDPDAYVFFPADIERMFSADVKPILLKGIDY